MYACEKAVAKMPGNAGFLDSRGFARALTGNTTGAIEDFQAVINIVTEGSGYTGYNRKWLDALLSRRQSWVDSLRADENPFTSNELRRLLNENLSWTIPIPNPDWHP